METFILSNFGNWWWCTFSKGEALAVEAHVGICGAKAGTRGSNMEISMEPMSNLMEKHGACIEML